MAFTFTLNVPKTDINQGILGMKAALKSGGWTIPQSGDGLAAGPVGDVLTTSTWNASAAGALGNANSWFRLMSPDEERELLFQQSSVAHQDDWIVRYSPYTGFVQSGDGAASATVAPTAADEVVLFGSARTGAGKGYAFGGLIQAAAQRWDYAIGDASEGYAFYALPRFSPAGNHHGGIYYDVLTGAEATDKEPVVIWLPANDIQASSSNSNFHSNALHSDTGNWQPKFAEHAPRVSGQASEPWAFQRDSAVERAIAKCVLPDLMLVNGTEILNSTSFNVYDGNFDVIEGVDWFHSNIPSVSGLTGFVGLAARGAYKGRSRLLVGYSGQGLNAMDTDTALLKVYQPSDFGAIWTLWDGATTPVL